MSEHHNPSKMEYLVEYASPLRLRPNSAHFASLLEAQKFADRLKEDGVKAQILTRIVTPWVLYDG